MNDPCVVVVGFGFVLLSQLDRFLPPASVIVVEDPDVIEKRGILTWQQEITCLRTVVPARYHQDLECVDAVVAFCSQSGATVSAVLPGQEYGVPGAAALADRLGLPGATPVAAAALTDKLLMREAAAASGIRVPEWREVYAPDDVADFAADSPVVLKPANLQGSLGVQILPPGSDLHEAWAITENACGDVMLPDRKLSWRYIAERLVTGHEYSAEALVAAGKVVFLNVTDKLTLAGRHPVTLGHIVPAPTDQAMWGLFAANMSRLADGLQFGTGILHAEWMAAGEGLVLIECAGRIPGGSLVDLIDLAYEFSLVRAMVAVLSGQEPALPGSARKASAIRFVTAAPGVITEVSGLDSAARREGIQLAEVSVGVGDEVSELRSSWDRIGEVIAVADSPAHAAAKAASAAATIQITCDGESAVRPVNCG